MANLFLASEILEMNISEEKNGAIFYQTLSETAKSKKVREVAAEIAKQEQMHEKRFMELLEEVEERHPQESYPGEFDAYVNNLLRNKMFPDEKAARTKAQNKSDKEAVEFALNTEHATLNLLNELKKHVDPKELKVINLTIEEEKDHINRLTDLLKELE